MGCLLEIWIQVAGIYAAVASYAAILAGWFREFHRFDRTRLVADVFVDALNLWCIYEGALYTHRFVAVEIEHITTTDELVGSRSVEDGLGVDGRSYLEGDTAREVRLDVTSDDAGGRTLGSDDHVDTHGTCQLGDAGDRKLYLLASCHDQISKLIDNHHDVWHEFVTISQFQSMVHVFLIILLDVSGSRLLQQVVAAVHQHAEAVQRSHHLGYIGDDRLLLIRNGSHKLVGDA